MARTAIKLKLNGKAVEALVEPRTLLIHFLREQADLTGPHIGCETTQCGACTVDLDGRSVKSCTVFAVQADGAEILTVEGTSGPDGSLHLIKTAAFARRAGTPVVGRRALLAAMAGLAAAAPFRSSRAQRPVYFGLTPVFLDSDIELLAALQDYLSTRLGQPVTLVKRRTYQEITAMLLSEQLDAAWICGFPLVQHVDQLSLMAVPVWRGQPLYRSYLIAGADDPVQSIVDMRGYVHAFSDPDSNSGFLVTRHLLTTMHERPDSFFSRYFFTYGHRDVIRAVAAGLAQSGSVDGYVWEVVREIEPRLTDGTRVVRRSELLGFPPVACSAKLRDTPNVKAITDVLVTMDGDEAGRQLLRTLRLDRFVAGSLSLFDGIAEKYREVRGQV